MSLNTSGHELRLLRAAQDADTRGPWYPVPDEDGTCQVQAGPNHETVASGLTPGNAAHIAGLSPDVVASLLSVREILNAVHAASLPVGSILQGADRTVWLLEPDGWIGTGLGDVAYTAARIEYPAHMVRRGPHAA